MQSTKMQHNREIKRTSTLSQCKKANRSRVSPGPGIPGDFIKSYFCKLLIISLLHKLYINRHCSTFHFTIIIKCIVTAHMVQFCGC